MVAASIAHKMMPAKNGENNVFTMIIKTSSWLLSSGNNINLPTRPTAVAARSTKICQEIPMIFDTFKDARIELINFLSDLPGLPGLKT